MKLITWNTQWCRGVDGKVDPARIVNHARAFADIDVPDEKGGRRHFGNMIFSRYPVGQVFRHLLPYPVDPGVNGMPRIALEAIVSAPFGSVRVLTTHLEYYGVN